MKKKKKAMSDKQNLKKKKLKEKKFKKKFLSFYFLLYSSSFLATKCLPRNTTI